MLSITFVNEVSTIAELGLWLKSEDTRGSLLVSKIFFNFDFEAFIKELFIFSAVKLFGEENTNSIKDTFGVGTLIETPLLYLLSWV